MSLRPSWIAVVAVVVLGAACEKKASPPNEPPVAASDAPPAIDAEAPPADAEVPAVADAAAEVADAGAAAATPAGKPPAGKPPGKAADPAPAGTPPGEPPATAAPDKAPRAKPPSSTSDGRSQCGGIAGFSCKKGEKCRYGKSLFKPGYSDAMGSCVAETYCDAAKDCEGLIHPMVVGTWACEKSGCAWKAETGAPQ
jgi:hypothetical protein